MLDTIHSALAYSLFYRYLNAHLITQTSLETRCVTAVRMNHGQSALHSKKADGRKDKCWIPTISIILLLLLCKTQPIPHDAIWIPAHTSHTNNCSKYTLFILPRSTIPKLQYLSAQEGVLERISTAPSVRPYAS